VIVARRWAGVHSRRGDRRPAVGPRAFAARWSSPGGGPACIRGAVIVARRWGSVQSRRGDRRPAVRPRRGSTAFTERGLTAGLCTAWTYRLRRAYEWEISLRRPIYGVSAHLGAHPMW